MGKDDCEIEIQFSKEAEEYLEKMGILDKQGNIIDQERLDKMCSDSIEEFCKDPDKVAKLLKQSKG